MKTPKLAPTILLLAILTSCFILSSSTENAVASNKTIVVPDDFSNIQDAVGNATAGDTVYVKPGTYELPEKYDYSLVISESISLVGENPENTIIVTNQTYSVFFGWSYGIALHDNSSISGFTITGNYSPFILSGEGRITNNVINLTSNGRTAIWALSGNISSNIINGYEQGGNGIETWSGNITISNNIIRNFNVGVHVGSKMLIILNNTLTDNEKGFFIQKTPLLVWGNNVENSTQCGLRANFGVNVTYNWWGTNDSQAVSDKISASGYDQTRWGPIIYLPYLNTSNSQARPVQNLMATPNDTPTVNLPHWITIAIIACVILIVTVFLLKSRQKTAT